MGCKFGLSVICYRVVVEISSHTSVPIFEYPREREQFAPYIEYAVLHSQHRVGLERGSDNMMECALLQYIETRCYRNYRYSFEIAYEISYYANDIKDLWGNPKPRVSPDLTGPDRNLSGVGEHFKEYFSGRVGPGRGSLFRVGPGRGIFYRGMRHFLLGFRG